MRRVFGVPTVSGKNSLEIHEIQHAKITFSASSVHKDMKIDAIIKLIAISTPFLLNFVRFNFLAITAIK